jgi:hypothetical protein
MKTFLDRLLPLMKPYMVNNENGSTMHPDRYPEKGEHAWLMGEFFLPAAELIAQPVDADRKERIRNACFSAGRR